MSQLALDRSAPDDRAASREARVAEGRREAEAAPAEAPKVFISYSRKDMAFVDRLEAALRECGIAPLVDRRDIEKSEDWWLRIEGLIEEAGAVVFVLSPDSVSSEVCEKEVAFAAGLNKRIAPVVARAITTSRVPDALGRLNYTFLDTEAGWQAELDGLVRALTIDFAWVRQHAEYGKLARRWAGEGRPSTLLLRGRALEEAQRWIAARPANAEAPTEEMQALVIASRSGARQRRRMLTAALALGFVLALGLAAAAFWQRQVAVANEQRATEQTKLAIEREADARREKAEADSQRSVADAERLRAQRALSNAKSAADGLIFDVAQAFRGRGLPVAVIRSVLERSQRLMARLVESAPDDPGLLRSQGSMLLEFSNTYAEAGAIDKQRESAQAALPIFRRLVTFDSNEALYERDLSVALEKLGDAQMAGGDPNGAKVSYNESLTIRRRFGSAKPFSDRDVAVSLEKLASAEISLGAIDEAEDISAQALTISRRLLTVNPNDASILRDLAGILEQYGQIKVNRRDWSRSKDIFLELLLIRRRVLAADPYSTENERAVAVALSKIGDVFQNLGELVSSDASFTESLKIDRRLQALDPSNMVLARDTELSAGRLGAVKAERGDFVEARVLIQESIMIARRLASLDATGPAAARDLAGALMQAAILEMKDKRYAESCSFVAESLSIFSRFKEVEGLGFQEGLTIARGWNAACQKMSAPSLPRPTASGKDCFLFNGEWICE